ncbi:hypothetical protein D9611_003590 [Ephemerocybe angulata]|uniref:F-box domain-containing protein n=1 Tax=Ephemerocybe angulata TaxID=980116 RepID=A0A8H5B747_9AGAR|nr:hypothetical protein D9611_003590 [Tulosesus angulatus]
MARTRGQKALDEAGNAEIGGTSVNDAPGPAELGGTSAQETCRREPQRKKARVTSEVGQSIFSNRGRSERGRKDLSLLPELPLDILLQIFLLLDPEDLLQVMVANKVFYRTLARPPLNIVWKLKREEYNAPEPAPGFTEARWMAFLFNSECCVCGALHSGVEFFLLKRICRDCRKNHYLTREDFGRNFPDSDIALLDFVPCTYYGAQSEMWGGNEPYYWEHDARETETAWKSLQQDISSKKRGAPKRLEAFKKERREFIDKIEEAADSSNEWASYLREERVETIIRRFVSLGYFQEDVRPQIENSRHFIILHGSANISDRVFETLKQKYEILIIKRRDERLRRLKIKATYTRCNILAKAWHSWLSLSTAPTSETLTYPRTHDLFHLPEVKAILDLDPSISVTTEDFQPIADDFPNIISRFIAKRTQDLTKQLPRSNYKKDSKPHPLKLATSVFCKPTDLSPKRQHGYPGEQGEVLIGWDMLSTCHFSASENDKDVLLSSRLPVYSDILSQHARMLVEDVCGFDPYTTTAKQMDAHDERFYCELCQESNDLTRFFGGHWEIESFTWRSALTHAWWHIFGEDGDEDEESLVPFDTLDAWDPELRERVRAKESIKSMAMLEALPVWYCNHCREDLFNDPFLNGHEDPSELYGQSGDLPLILKHLKKHHKIREPKERVDYLFNQMCRSYREQRVTMAVEEGETADEEEESGEEWDSDDDEEEEDVRDDEDEDDENGEDEDDNDVASFDNDACEESDGDD